MDFESDVKKQMFEIEKKKMMINILLIHEEIHIPENEYLCSFKTQKYRDVGYNFFQIQ